MDLRQDPIKYQEAFGHCHNYDKMAMLLTILALSLEKTQHMRESQ